MSKSVWDLHQEAIQKYGTADNTFADFPVGTKVKIITPCEDHYFFYGETGVVIRNSGRYLGIIVEFDEPRRFEGGHVQKEFNFAPSSLIKHTPEPRMRVLLKRALAYLRKDNP